jgi:hypothetical protein
VERASLGMTKLLFWGKAQDSDDPTFLGKTQASDDKAFQEDGGATFSKTGFGREIHRAL